MSSAFFAYFFLYLKFSKSFKNFEKIGEIGRNFEKILKKRQFLRIFAKYFIKSDTILQKLLTFILKIANITLMRFCICVESLRCQAKSRSSVSAARCEDYEKPFAEGFRQRYRGIAQSHFGFVGLIAAKGDA